MKRKIWIDNLRGFCMLAILLDHTELYYAGKNIIDYNFYVVNALVIFFFLSGYLMYKNTSFNIKHKLESIMRTLLMPYLVFTTLMCIPKCMIHDNGIDFKYMIIDIVTGQASWFVAALCLAEFLFSIILWLSKGKDYLIGIAALVGLVSSVYLPINFQPYIWQLDNALQALLFLSMGFLYHKHEDSFQKKNKAPYIAILFIILIVIKIYEYHIQAKLTIWNIHIDNYPLFLLDIIVGNLAIIQLFKQLPKIQLMNWIGRHSIVYYFLCGGIPLIVSKLLNYVGASYHNNYIMIIVAYIMVCITSTLITYLIYQYIPFITGNKNE